jgi:hypothetical protein
MAQYEHLPIYRGAFKFLIYCETIVHYFARYHKYTHGTDLRDTARAVIKRDARRSKRLCRNVRNHHQNRHTGAGRYPELADNTGFPRV